MNKCMVANATQENHDVAREEWFRQRMEKKKLKHLEESAVEVIKGRQREGDTPAAKRAGV